MVHIPFVYIYPIYISYMFQVISRIHKLFEQNSELDVFNIELHKNLVTYIGRLIKKVKIAL